MRINAVDPGYTATDLNGHTRHPDRRGGRRRSSCAMAQIGPDGPTGTFVVRPRPGRVVSRDE